MPATYPIGQEGPTILPTGRMWINSKRGTTSKIAARFFMDSGSQSSFMTLETAERLNIRGREHTRSLVGINGATQKIRGFLARVYISPFADEVAIDAPIEIEVFVMRRVTSPFQAILCDPRENFDVQYGNLSFAEDFPIMNNYHVDLLLGADSLPHILTSQKPIFEGGLMGLPTKLGWVIQGRLNSNFKAIVSSCVTGEEQLDFHLRKFWEVESLGILEQPQETKENLEVLNQFKNTLKFDPNEGRYFVRFQFISETILLKSNYEIAFRRLCSAERRLSQDAAAADSYRAQVREILDKGWAEKVRVGTLDELGLRQDGTYYLPHALVVRPDAESTKHRLVFDGSCKNSDKVSINNVLHRGPKTQSDIFVILLRLRLFRICLKADIRKMFHQLGLVGSDKDFVRFLWRDLDVSKPVEVYRWRRLPFGLNQSPFLAIATVQEHVEIHSNEFPEAADALRKCLYVDDFIGGAQSEAEAVFLREQVQFMCDLGGFHFTKWISNSSHVLSTIPEEDRAAASAFAFQERDLDLTEEPLNKTLGLSWNPQSDQFCYYGYAGIVFEPGKESKRTLISKMSRIFDPTGFLSPFLIRAKILMQQCWLAGISWDEPLPPSIEEEWRKWLGELPDLAYFSPPRCLMPKAELDHFSLHMFSDASEKAYATVAYLRFVESSDVSTEGEVTCGLLAAKSRVAPLKKLSLPRLELMGVLLSARMADTIVKELGLERSSVRFFTDNTTAVQWIRKSPSNWSIYVANRVSEIQKSFSPDQFYHIPGVENVSADIASRGCSARDLGNIPEWLEAPWFLYEPEELWPVNLSIGETNLEATTHSFSALVPDPFWSRLEELVKMFRSKSYGCLQRIAIWILRFIRTGSDKSSRHNPPHLDATIAEVRSADLFWCRLAQQSCLLTEITSVKGGEVPASLRNLSPFWDEKDQILRVGGRLQEADLPEYTVHPIILPTHHPIVEKMILHYHNAHLHSGLLHTHHYLRQRFWLLKGKRELRRILYLCMRCRRQKAKPFEQKMAPLPPERLQQNLAFSIVGVDTAGPIKVKNDCGKTVDVHIAVWTCFSTRAVHLNVLNSLHTDSIISALKEFTYRRGVPKQIYSDNHKSFAKSDREIRKLWKHLDTDKIRREALSLPQPIEWHFITERAPWQGGIWERMVRSVKTSLRACIGQALVTKDELQLFLAGVESQINSRPLTALSNDPTDMAPLTPAHLLLGRGLLAVPDYITKDDTRDKVAIRWKHRCTLLQHFWRRWRKEYLVSLQAAQKWHEAKRAPKIGEIVLIGEDTPRSQWVLGVVEECKEGRDGLVRSCLLSTPRGLLRRPIQRLYRMEADVEEKE